MESVRQGATYSFLAGISGDNESSFGVDMAVMKYPDDTPSISRSLTYSSSDSDFKGVLTSSETAALSVGRWWIHIKATDSTEDIREPIALDVVKGWI